MTLILINRSGIAVTDGKCVKNISGGHTYLGPQVRHGEPILGSKCAYCGDLHPGWDRLGQEKPRDAGIGHFYARYVSMLYPERLQQDIFQRAYKKHMDSLNLPYVTADVRFAWEHYKDNPHKYLFVLPFVGELI